MTFKQEMDEYRNSFKAKRGRRGKRRLDHKEPQFWDIGLTLDILVLLVGAAMLLLTACSGRLQ